MRQLLTIVLFAAAAAPALAEPLVYECKIDRRGSVKYTDAMRADPENLERFAVDMDAGKVCILNGPGCSPFFGTLTATQKGQSISAGGKRTSDGKPITLVFFPERQQVIMTFDGSQVTSRPKDCRVTDLKAVIG